MALTTSQAVRAGNGLGGRTHIMSVATGTNMEGVITEAMNEGFTIAAVEGTANGNHVAIQGTATPSITNAVLVVTFED
jgi:hypothetical protein